MAKQKAVELLRSQVKENLEQYRDSHFHNFLHAQENTFELKNKEYDPKHIQDLKKPPEGASSLRRPDQDAENSLIMYQGLEAITPYLAMDERLWTFLCHEPAGLEYMRRRWPIPVDDEEAVKYIRSHFFARGDRGFKRNNGLARLWWHGHLSSKFGGATLTETLEVFLYQTDVRAQVLERPTTSNSDHVFSAIMRLFMKKYSSDKEFFDRKNDDGPYRRFMKILNERGGIRLLSSLQGKELDREMENFAAQGWSEFRNRS